MSKQNTNEISYEEFSRLDIRIGLIKFAEKIPGSHKLLRLIIDLGPSIGERQIISGIAESYKPEELVGKKVPVLTNLKPKKFLGYVSEGMILAIGCESNQLPVLLLPEKDVSPGTKVC